MATSNQPRERPATDARSGQSAPPSEVAWLLACVTFLLYAIVYKFDFVNYDDPDYVYNNAHVSSGLRWPNIVWAFTTQHGGTSYWHPLTWLSHMLDCELFGLQPGAHHLTNVLLHTLNTVLVFWMFRRLTGSWMGSALLAAGFGWHPAHVESVAWISERKDLLCGTFWLLTLGAYEAYVRRPGIARYLPVVALTALALMSKPMAVTLPFTLLLLDFWPLNRWRLASAALTNGGWRPLVRQGFALVVEKLPLFGLSLLVCLLTLAGQREIGATPTLSEFPLPDRIANAFASYGAYIQKTLWPSALQVLYLAHGPVSAGRAALGVLLTFGLSILAVMQAVKRPYLLAGWFWYLGTLVPVIGLVQAGGQSMADRYLYLPMIGLLIMLIWGAMELLVWRPAWRPWLATGATLGVVAMLAGTRAQLHTWRDSLTLWTQCLRHDDANSFAHNNLGNAYLGAGKPELALAHFEKAVLAYPGNMYARVNIGNVLLDQGKSEAALAYYDGVLKEAPDSVFAFNGKGRACLRLGRTTEGVAALESAIKLMPELSVPYHELAAAFLTNSGNAGQNTSRAIHYAEEGCRVTQYKHPDLLRVLSRSYSQAGKAREAGDIARLGLDVAVAMRRPELIRVFQSDLDRALALTAPGHEHKQAEKPKAAN